MSGDSWRSSLRVLARLGGEEALLAAGQGAYLGEGPDGTVTAGAEPLRYVCAGGHVPGGHHH